jgi:hypothetical protein
MRLNAKRGLFRLWLIAAVLWGIAAGAWLRPDQTIMHLWRGPSQDELAVWPFACNLSAPDERCLSLIGMWSAFNHPAYGIFHNISEAHLHRYLAEFDFSVIRHGIRTPFLG